MTALALLFALLAAGPATAQGGPSAGTDALFADANAAFLSSDLPRATALYQALLAEGVASPEVETNLGAALQRQGKRGAAALHFERALFLAPSDDDARADLIEIRKANVDRLEGESDDGGAEALTRLFGPRLGNGAALALLVLWTLAWIALGLRLYRPSLVSRAPLGAIAAALFTAATLAGLVAGFPAREGPEARSASPFEVHEATPVRLEDRQNGFARIRLANGLTGWVAQSAVELVVPPRWGGLPTL
jgi:tetratricopeptide (TPR) repeat protein